MTAAIDATYSLGRNLSGVGVYCAELMVHLARLNPGTRFHHYYRPHRILRALTAPRPSNAWIRPLFDGFGFGKPDVFHGLNQRMPEWKARRRVCTFHDLFVLTGEYSTPEFRERFAGQAREAAGRSDLIICVSEYTADVVNALLGVERERLRVVAHGVRFPERVEPGRERVILHVGAVQKRKNLVRLIDAFEGADLEGWELVLAGANGYGAEEVQQRAARSRRKESIRFTGWLTDKELLGWYRRASVFAFPSLDEGFGIPVLEAMAQGVPVVSSDRGALKEVCGDAALAVHAEDTEGLSEALRLAAMDERARASLIERGRRRAAEFTWERSAERTWRVYLELCGGG